MRPYIEKQPGARPLPYVANVSWPRSGHHLLVRLLIGYFGPRFGYCEYHGPSATKEWPCCGHFPCRKRGTISMSKNHDFELDSPIPTDVPIIVQWREPLAAIQSEFELAHKAGHPDTAAAFAIFAEKRAAKYRAFVGRWLESPIEGRLGVEYDELVTDPWSILTSALALWGELEPEPGRLASAIASVPHVSVQNRNVVVRDQAGVRAERKVEDFRYYDEALFDRIREIALGDAPEQFRRRIAASAAVPTGRPASSPTGGGAGTTPAAPAVHKGETDGPREAPDPAAKPAPRHNLRAGERVVFMHIPKCAGSSLSAMLAASFEPHEIFTSRDDVLPQMKPGEIRKYRYFSGHFSKYGVDAVPGPKRVVTVLREPRERILSLYHFWRSHRAEAVERLNLKGPAAARELSLTEFLKCGRPEVVSSISNSLVRTLLGPNLLSQSQGFRLGNRDYAVDTAILNLQRLSFVAFADTLEQDVKEMMPQLGLMPASQVPVLKTFEALKQNSANFEEIERQEPTEEDWRELNRLTALDLPFYRRARQLRFTLRCPYPM